MPRTTSLVRTFCALLAAAVSSCGGTASDGGGLRSVLSADPLALISTNGRSMNGRSMNGRSMNGTDLTGLSVTSVALQGAVVGSTTIKDAVLTASVFSSAKAKLSGAGFKGSVWTGTLSNGTTIALTVTALAALPAPNADVTGYAVTYPTSAGPQPLCGLEADGTPVLAVPAIGTWNLGQGVTGGGGYIASTTAFTFACRHAAIAKCLELGYRPWAKSGTTSLQQYQVACTRVLRADYCGDGSSYTVDGTVIDLYDRLSVQTDAAATWPVEAEWNVSGSACITPGTYDRFNLAGLAAPPCYVQRTTASSTCGSGGFGTIRALPTLIIDRYQQ